MVLGHRDFRLRFQLAWQSNDTKYWLGGLDSNQDSQSQSLESYQLDDLPAGRNKKESRHVRISRQLRFNHSNLIGNAWGVNRVGRIVNTS